VAKRFEVVGVDIYKPLSTEQIKKIKAKTRYLQNRETILAKAKERYNPVDQCCCIGFKAQHLKRIVKVCKDTERTSKKKGEHPPFKWQIYNSKFPQQYDFILMIFCGGGKEGADLAHKRGELFVKRYLADLNLLYWVNYKPEMEKHQVGEPAKC